MNRPDAKKPNIGCRTPSEVVLILYRSPMVFIHQNSMTKLKKIKKAPGIVPILNIMYPG